MNNKWWQSTLIFLCPQVKYNGNALDLLANCTTRSIQLRIDKALAEQKQEKLLEAATDRPGNTIEEQWEAREDEQNLESSFQISIPVESVVNQRLRSADQESKNPTKVNSIYVPLAVPVGKLNLSENNIRHLHEISGVVGITAASCVDQPGKVSLIYITQTEQYNSAYACFRAYELETGKQVGSAEVYAFLETNQYCQNFYRHNVPSHLQGYGADRGSVPKVFLRQVTNEDPKQYKNIGVLLLKMILQYYNDRCECRLILDAVRNTQPYYYKLGFRMANPEQEHLNANWAEIASIGKIPEDMGTHQMFLPDEARILWHNEITEYPFELPDMM